MGLAPISRSRMVPPPMPVIPAKKAQVTKSRWARAATSAPVLDPITVEVIGAALSSIVEETGEALIRVSAGHDALLIIPG